jgi:hypothetical protein
MAALGFYSPCYNESLGGRLDQDFKALMTAIPDHTAKSFQTLRQTAQSVSKYADVGYISNKPPYLQIKFIRF